MNPKLVTSPSPPSATPKRSTDKSECTQRVERFGPHPDRLAMLRQRSDTFDGLLRACMTAGVITRRAARNLEMVARKEPEMASSIHASGSALLEAGYAIHLAISNDRKPRTQDLALLNRHLSVASHTPELEWHARQMSWRPDTGAAGLDSILASLAWHIAACLTSISSLRSGVRQEAE